MWCRGLTGNRGMRWDERSVKGLHFRYKLTIGIKRVDIGEERYFVYNIF